MPDREKVLSGWDRCSKCLYPSVFDQQFKDCEYTMGMYCRKDKLISETVELLKEQEAKEQISDAIHETAKQFRQTIVRCKDCVYGMMFKNVKDEQRFECVSPTHNGTYVEAHDPDWFCADGERRTDNA